MTPRPFHRRRSPSLCAALAFLGALVLSAPAVADEGFNHGGVNVARSPAATRQYIGSPGLAVLQGGEYVASHDLFGPGSTRDRTRVYLSTDRGASWGLQTEITGQWWSTLFVHRGALHLMGTSREYGFAVIRRSTDSGKTWTEPIDGATGLLHGDGKYHCAPVPVLIHNGRIWRAMEDAMGPGGWGTHFRSFMMSAPADADLLRADSWTSSNRLERDPSWLKNTFKGWLEGNAVATPEGEVVDLLRVDYPGYPELGARVSVSPDGVRADFDPATGFFEMPGGAKKFTIRHDPASGYYWSLVNAVPEDQRQIHPARTRNTLALARSKDLRNWEVGRTILSHPDKAKHGFQYVEWLFEGEDMIALIRAAFDGADGPAHNNHDANHLIFLRIPGFRGFR